MRLALFTNSYHPMINGVVTNVDLIRYGTEVAGNDVMVFTAKHKKAEVEKNVERFPSFVWPPAKHYPVPIGFSPSVKRQLCEFAPDIIHVHHPFVLGKVALKYAKATKTPIVMTFHTEYDIFVGYVPIPESWAKRLCNRIVRKYCNQLDHIITPAASKEVLLHGYGVTTPVTVVPNGINLEDYKISAATKRAFLQRHGLVGKKLAMYIGRISDEKNLEFLLQSWRIARRDTDAHLVIVGEGPMLEAYKNLAEWLGLNDCVTFTGPISYAEIPVAFSCARAATLCMLYETLPTTCLEAQAAGVPAAVLPAVWSNDFYPMNPGTSIFAEPTPESYAKVLLSLLQDDGLHATMRAACLESVVKYDLQNILRQITEVYQLAKKEGGRA